ncbi:unnamed protein product [Angiostrongylus costaricensis]|uniref:VWFA domain-containing protein n=1 Tax=Angiostrongylus costaricensis TaxID=334426 RepID=A0A158PKZ5_ANGCS|nr:unnamed protein product [Angiostrongylus costaricensis]
MFEQKWIAGEWTCFRNQIWYPGQALDNMEGRLANEKSDKYAIITSKGLVAAFRSGTVVPIMESTHLPVMCSRPAPINAHYPKAITEKMKELGFKSFVYNDASKQPRPFIILRALIEFEVTNEFSAGGKRLHQACESLRNGYAATPLDFYNVNDFKAMLKEAKVNIVGVPGSRIDSVGAKNNEQCAKGPYPGRYRNDFFFELKNGGMKSAREDKYWRPTFPDRFCADTPRTALGFSQEGLVDIPNSARMFVVCTYGEESRATDEDRAAKCSKHATYDKKTDTCTCMNPFSDLKYTNMFITTENDKSRKQGTKCVNCQRPYDHEFAIVVENNKEMVDRREAIKHLLRVFAYIGLVTNSRMKLFLYADSVTSGRYRTPEGVVPHLRAHFEYEYEWPKGQGKKLAPALQQVYEFFKNKATDRKVLVIITNGLPSDLEEAKKAKESGRIRDVGSTRYSMVFFLIQQESKRARVEAIN